MSPQRLGIEGVGGENLRQALVALTAGEPVSCALNIASGRPDTVGEMAAAMAQAAGGPAPQVTGEFRLGDVRHVFADTDRAAEALGFRAQEDFGAAMAELLLGT